MRTDRKQRTSRTSFDEPLFAGLLRRTSYAKLHHARSLSSADSRSEIQSRLASLRPDDTALWGRMTAPQMMHHLASACEMALGERPANPVKGLPPALMKWVALRSGFRWPKNFKTTPDLARELELHAANLDHTTFESDLATVKSRLDQLANGNRYAAIHPFFDTMTPEDWMRWAYLHTDHHLRQFGR